MANALNFKFALQDSHSILSIPTFTQPLLAQASELAAYIKTIPWFRKEYRVQKRTDKVKGHILPSIHHVIPVRVEVRKIANIYNRNLNLKKPYLKSGSLRVLYVSNMAESSVGKIPALSISAYILNHFMANMNLLVNYIFN